MRASRLAGIVVALVLIAVGIWTGIRLLGGARKRQEAGNHAGSQKQAGALYHCPMHPTMQSDKPGSCPICGMKLVPVEPTETEGASPSGAPPSRLSGGKKKLVYRSTMNPSEVSDRPGKDSMGMEMVPVETEEADDGGVEGLASVRLSTAKRQLIGVRTTRVTRGPVVREVKTVGRVAVDETRLHHVHSKVEGWIEQLHVIATGEAVRKGQPLLSLYSPELLASQQEFLLALKASRDLSAGSPSEARSRAQELVESARKRLLLFDLTEGQIDELEKTGQPTRTITLFSPLSGIVMQRNVTHGERIDPNTPLLDVADLSKVWVLASVYEYELPFVKPGQKAAMTLAYLPGKRYAGRVSLIYPILDAASRTVQVRLEFANPQGELKPEMYADVELQGELGVRTTLPESAVLSSGTRDIVFVDRGDGYFDPREVKIGVRLPGSVEILDGVRQGESVVSSANFLVDSESKLKAALEAAAAPPPPSTGRRKKPQAQTAPSGAQR